MKIQIDISGYAQQQLSALIAAMMAYGSLTPDALADIVAPLDTPRGGDGPTSDIQTLGFGVVARGMLARVKEAENSELTTLIAELNAEIYSRRVISPNDDPSAGVEKRDLAQFSNESLTQRFSDEVVKPAIAPIVAALDTLDLASVFAQAQGGVVSDKVAESFADKTLGKPFVAGTIQLDKAGLPWDSRIHAGSKAINQTDGLWRQRRGVDPAVVATVEAELRQAMSVPRGGEVAREEQPDGKVTDVDPSDKGADVVKVPPPPPTVVTPPAPPPAANTGEIDSLPRLLKFITEQKLAGKLNQTQVNQALIAVGIEGPLPVLQARPDLIPVVAGKLRVLAGV